MKRILLIACCFFLLIFVSGCQSQTNDLEKQAVSINLPYDDSVNGYRTEANTDTPNSLSEEELDKIIEEILNAEEVSKEEITKEEITQEENVSSVDTETVAVSYCGNKNSKVFHNADCGSVKNMKDSNKVYLQGRDEFIQNGYTPCKKCNP